jgi:Fur family ferric uptake transcriptional regulator|tara:strand:- start:1390 stop:1815 length:426 start_codon:yes stop_codon:yes gene_type:complete
MLEQEHLMAELYDRCLKVGLRMTLPRKIILEVIEASEDHPDVDEMYRRAVEKDRSISIATVYRTIKLFEEAGIIERLDIGDGRSRYEEAGEHHEHLIDVESGEIIEFQNEELEEMKRQVALKMGYELVDHRLELFGKKIKN